MPATWISRGTVLIQLGRHHFAFFRGYLNGLDLRQLAKRYMETSQSEPSGAAELRTARALVSWIEGQLMAAARRTGNGSAARVLRMAPEKLGALPAPDAPGLEEFRLEHDPHQMFSELELLELFQQEHGGPAAVGERRVKRNARLRARQIALLTRLEELAGAAPHLRDGVDGWLDPAIARRLIDADIRTLDELVAVIEAHGFRWYTKVPRIGVRAARHIVDWLQLPETTEALGVTLSIRGVFPRKHITAAMLPPLPRRQDIVPIERFEIPPAMNGAHGSNRGDACSITARNDLDAIMAWLARSKPGSHTARAYRKEAERFLLWSVLEAGKGISSLVAGDCMAYRSFLQTLGRETGDAWTQRFRIPQDRWLGQRGIDRFSSRWRPFEGPLSPSSQQTALVIVQGMMQWLCTKNYLKSNPFKTLPVSGGIPKAPRVLAALSDAQWQYVEDYLTSVTRDERYYRVQFILALACGTGCRLPELASLKRSDMESFMLDDAQEMRWEIIVRGSKKAARRVHLNQRLVAEIESHFCRRGYASLATVPAQTPLITALAGPGSSAGAEAPISAARIYKVLKSFFAEVAASIGEQDAGLAATYRNVSPRWLCNTFAARRSQTT